MLTARCVRAQVLFCKLTTEQRDMYRAYLASKVSDAALGFWGRWLHRCHQFLHAGMMLSSLYVASICPSVVLLGDNNSAAFVWKMFAAICILHCSHFATDV